jgi:hypothetical protein
MRETDPIIAEVVAAARDLATGPGYECRCVGACYCGFDERNIRLLKALRAAGFTEVEVPA